MHLSSEPGHDKWQYNLSLVDPRNCQWILGIVQNYELASGVVGTIPRRRLPDLWLSLISGACTHNIVMCGNELLVNPVQWTLVIQPQGILSNNVNKDNTCFTYLSGTEWCILYICTYSLYLYNMRCILYVDMMLWRGRWDNPSDPTRLWNPCFLDRDTLAKNSDEMCFP